MADLNPFAPPIQDRVGSALVVVFLVVALLVGIGLSIGTLACVLA